MSSFSDEITQILKSSALQYELRIIQEWATNELYKAVQDTVYSQPEGSSYTRTYDLLASILPTELIVTNSSIEFKVIFDESTMHHYSLYGSEKYGLSPGDPIGDLIVPFLNEGWKWEGYEGDVDNFRFREGAKFLEEAIAKIQSEVVSKVQGALSAEVKKIGGRY
jgi:hypothetical protein